MAEYEYEDQDEKKREMVTRRNGRNYKLKLPFITVCLIIAGIMIAMAVHIHNQNQLLAVCSQELAQKTHEIEIQSAEIAEKGRQTYEQTLREHCILGAGKALSLLRRGDRIGALKTALSVFPGEGREELPYTPQAAYALAESMHLYGNGSRVVPNMRLETDSDIRFMKMSADGSRILAVTKSDAKYIVWVWLTESGTLTDKFILADGSNKASYHFIFLDDVHFAYPTASGLAVYDTEKHENAYELRDIDYWWITPDETGRRFLLWGNEYCCMVQTETGDILHEIPGEALSLSYKFFPESDNRFAFCGDDRYAIAVTEPQKALKIYDADDGTLLNTYPVSGDNGEGVSFLRYVDGTLYLGKLEVTEYDEWDNAIGITTLSAIDIENGETLWVYRSDENRAFRDVVVSGNEDYPYLVLVGYDSAVIIDWTDGGFRESFSFDYEIKTYGDSITDDTFLAITENGVWHYLEFRHAYWGVAHRTEENFVYDTRHGFDDVIIQDGCVAALHDENDNEAIPTQNAVTIYRSAVGSGLEVFLESNTRNLYTNGIVDPSGRYLAVQRWKGSVDLEVYDTANGSLLWTYTAEKKEYGEEKFMALSFYPERDALVLMTDRGIRLFDLSTGKQLDYYPYYDRWNMGLDVSTDHYIDTDAAGRYVFIREFDTIFGYDLSDGSPDYRITIAEDESIYANGMDFAVSSDMDYLAVANVYTHSIQLFHLSDWRTDKNTKSGAGTIPNCIAELDGVNANSVSALFFGEREAEGLELYVMYSNGDMEVYSIRETSTDLQSDVTGAVDVTNLLNTINEKTTTEESGLYIEEIPVRTYQGLEERLTNMVNATGQEYMVVAGVTGSGAYLLSADDAGYGQIMAHIEGFMALDPVHNQLYLTDAYTDNRCIYRVSVYDADMLAAEAARQLGEGK